MNTLIPVSRPGYFLSICAVLAVVLLFGAVPARADITTGLVGWWRLDETSGTTAHDASGKGNNGILYNIATPATATSGWNSGHLNGALAFDGIDDWVNIPDNESLRCNGNFTIAFWYKMISEKVQYPGVISKDGGWDVNTGYYIFSAGTQLFYKRDAFQFLICPPSSDWVHVAVAYDGAVLKAYVDGSLAYNYSVSYVTGTDAESLKFASAGWVGSFGNIHLDDVRIYNRALTQTDVTQLYNNGGPTKGRNGVLRNALIR